MVHDVHLVDPGAESPIVTVAELETALREVRTLRGILPICSFCKRIRDDQGYWAQVESYLSQHTEANLSHGVCPDCMAEHYPEA